MRVLNYILGMISSYTSIWMNEMKYVWMNEADFVLDKEVSLVEVLYVEPSFLESLDVKYMIPQSHGVWTNDMNDVMCYMHYVMYYV